MSKKPTAEERKAKMIALRAKWKAEEDNAGNKSTFAYNSDIYPFWTMDDNEEAEIRIIRDANFNNDEDCVVYRFHHSLELNGKKEKIMCPKTYGDKCPICELSAKYYKEEGKDSVNGKKYWTTKLGIVRALIVEDPLPVPDTGIPHKGQVRVLQLGHQLMNKFKRSLVHDLAAGDEPWSQKDGLNFKIVKTPDGQWAKYDMASDFVRKWTPITDHTDEKVEETDLSELLPKVKSYTELEDILDASISGTPYDFKTGTSESNDKDDDEEEEEKSSKKDKKDKKKDKKKGKKDKKKDKKSGKKFSPREYENEDDVAEEESEDEAEDEDADEMKSVLADIRNRKKQKKNK